MNFSKIKPKKSSEYVAKVKKSKNTSPIAASKTVDDHVLKFMNDMMEDVSKVTFTQPAKYLPEFRVSSFPYCPVLDYEAMLAKEPREENYNFKFYVDLGTAAHESIQRFLPYVPRLGKTARGSWICTKCKHLHKKKSGKPQKRVKSCTKCGNTDMMYEEAEFKFTHAGVTLSGHLDYLTYDKNIGWVAWEFKTTGDKYIQDEYYQKFLPYAKHPHQIKTYGALLSLCYGIEISYYNIIYIARSDPHTKETKSDNLHRVHGFKFSKVDRAETISRIKQACLSRSKALAAYTEGKKKRPIWDNRPCKTRKDWNGMMTDAFFANDKCPHLDTCTKKDGKPMKFLRANKK